MEESLEAGPPKRRHYVAKCSSEEFKRESGLTFSSIRYKLMGTIHQTLRNSPGEE